MTPRRILAIVALCIIIGIVPAVPAVAQQADALLNRKIDCADRPQGRDYDDAEAGVICGVLQVPENWDEPDGRQIEIGFAVLETTSDNPSLEPLIYLQGGPGGELASSPLFFDSIFAQHRRDRDLIIFDQRGAGLSSPLACEDYVDGYADTNQNGFGSYRTVRECADGLRADGVDLTQYNSVNNAHDVMALMQSLAAGRGYARYHVYGLSYGTRLALVMLRQYPDDPLIASVTLDSPFPTQIRQFEQIPAIFQEVLTNVFTTCATDAECDTAYPNLKARYLALLDGANDPLRRSFNSANALDELVLVNGLRAGIDVSPLFAAYIPRLIQAFEDGDSDLFYTVLYTVLDEAALEAQDLIVVDTISSEMYWSLQCREEIAFESEDGVRAAIDALEHPLLGAYSLYNYESLYDVCRGWDNGSAEDDFKLPVSSNLPILILQGDFDMRTPPSWGRAAAETLPNATYLRVPATGHGTINENACISDITSAYMNDPSLAIDSSCLGGLALKFIMPDDVIENDYSMGDF